MVALSKLTFTTHAQYLERERSAESAVRSEYHNGEIVAMTGATWTHNRLAGRIARSLGTQFERNSCEVVQSDQRVRVHLCNRDFYPDVVVVCGRPTFLDATEDTILNPTILVEVLSESTERFDRGEKWKCYRMLDSLVHYLLVSQYDAQLELFSRTDRSGHWNYDVVTGLEGILHISTPNCELRLSEIYADIALNQTTE